MNEPTPQQNGRRFLTSFIVLVVATILEVIYYPDIATTIYSLFGGHGGPGSSIGYFRDIYVLAGAVGFALLAGIALWTTRKSHWHSRLATILAWVTNLTFLTASVLWYFHSIGTASRYGGP